MIPIDLNQRGLRVGAMPQLPPGMAQKQPQQIVGGAQPVQSNEARNYGVAEALAQPISVDGGGWGEAVAEALAAGWRGRLARGERERELSAEREADKREHSGELAVTEALANFDPANGEQVVERLRTGAPEQALDLATALMRSHNTGSPTEQWSEPFAFEGGMAQRNTGNQYRVLTRPPAARAANAAPDLPPGFVWAD